MFQLLYIEYYTFCDFYILICQMHIFLHIYLLFHIYLFIFQICIYYNC